MEKTNARISWFDLLGAVHTKTVNGFPEKVETNGEALTLLADLRCDFIVQEMSPEEDGKEFDEAATDLGLAVSDGTPAPSRIYRIRRKRKPHYTAGYLCLVKDMPAKRPKQ